MKAFLDTSSLLKLYHFETGSKALQKSLQGVNEIILSEIAILEFRSAIWKKIRICELDKEVANRVISCFQNDYVNFQWIKLQYDIINAASDLLMKYGDKGLRSLDSLQLASAITLKDENCIFFTADKLLESFFKKENLNIV